MQIANEAEARYGRKVAWGATIDEQRVTFSHLAVPIMTRLRQDERRVLDTLVDSGVARSRSEALAWCVKLVGEHTDSWLANLRDAMAEVDKVRSTVPTSTPRRTRTHHLSERAGRPTPSRHGRVQSVR